MGYDECIKSTDYGLLIARGLIPGISHINKFGRSTNVDMNIDTDVWDGANPSNDIDIWTAPTQARIHDIASTDVNDDGDPVGTGARTLEVQGLDSNWDMQTEIITLNGTNNVPTVGSYIRIFRMKVMTIGSAGSNQGDITATARIDGTITAIILATNNQTLMAIYTVPLHRTGFITGFYSSLNKIGGNTLSVDTVLRVRENADQSDSPFQIKHITGSASNGANPHQCFFNPPLVVKEKSDIVLMVKNCSSNDTDVSGGFDIILIDH